VAGEALSSPLWATVGMTIQRRTAAGEVRAEHASEITVAPRSVALVPLRAPVAGFADATTEFLAAELGGQRALWFGVRDLNFAYADADLTVTAEPAPDGLEVRVEAAGLARDVLLQADRIHPRAGTDRGFVTLLPGESAVWHVRAPVELDPALVKAPWVLTDLASVLRR
jgi:beta-mannosidase